MSNQDADVIVVGCGPVGAYAAWQFASRGLEVIGLEKGRAEEPASTIGAFHFERFAFDRAGIPLLPDEEVICKYPGLTVHSPDGRHAVQVPGVETWALDLDGFIQNLRRRAEQAGTRLTFGVEVTDVIQEEGRVTGVRAGGGPGKQPAEYRARVVVDATGLARAVRSRVAAFHHPGEDSGFSVYMEYWRNAQNPPGEGIHSYLGRNAWTARYPDYWIAGMGRPGSPEETIRAYRDWVKVQFPGNQEVIRGVRGTIPYAFSPPTFVDHGVLILGDAAATNKPHNGEGISSSLVLARIAAEVLPRAVASGATRAALWEINRCYFTGEGSRFAFLRAMGFSLLEQPEEELNAAFEIGLVNGEDLSQVFVDHRVSKPLTRWLGPLARLLPRGRMAARYGRAVFRAARLAGLLDQYPAEEGFPAWRRDYEKQIAAVLPRRRPSGRP